LVRVKSNMRAATVCEKAQRRITFGERTVHAHVVECEEMERYDYHPERDRNYRHAVRHDIDEAEQRAAAKADALARELRIAKPALGKASHRIPTQATPARKGAIPPSGQQKWCGPVEWLMDSGSAVDLVSRSDVPGWYVHEIEPIGHALELCTANGRMKVDKKVTLQVGALNEVIEPLVLPNTPAVLSLGKRCMEGGCSFVWSAGHHPTITDPRGDVHTLEVRDYVPYLLDGPDELAEREARVVSGAEPIVGFA